MDEAELASAAARLIAPGAAMPEGLRVSSGFHLAQRDQEKARLRQALSEFVPRAVKGCILSVVSAETGWRAPYLFTMDSRLTRISLQPLHVHSAASITELEIKLRDVVRIYKDADVQKAAPFLGREASSCVGIDIVATGPGQGRRLFFYQVDALEREKLFTCLKVLRMAIDVATDDEGFEKISALDVGECMSAQCRDELQLPPTRRKTFQSFGPEQMPICAPGSVEASPPAFADTLVAIPQFSKSWRSSPVSGLDGMDNPESTPLMAFGDVNMDGQATADETATESAELKRSRTVSTADFEDRTSEFSSFSVTRSESTWTSKQGELDPGLSEEKQKGADVTELQADEEDTPKEDITNDLELMSQVTQDTPTEDITNDLELMSQVTQDTPTEDITNDLELMSQATSDTDDVVILKSAAIRPSGLMLSRRTARKNNTRDRQHAMNLVRERPTSPFDAQFTEDQNAYWNRSTSEHLLGRFGTGETPSERCEQPQLAIRASRQGECTISAGEMEEHASPYHYLSSTPSTCAIPEASFGVPMIGRIISLGEPADNATEQTHHIRAKPDHQVLPDCLFKCRVVSLGEP